jgi:hypothetical protein
MELNETKENKTKIDLPELNRLNIFDEHNHQFPISNLWKKNTAIIVFVRHFGCVACRAHVDQLWTMKNDLEATGGLISFIGNGEPEIIREFRGEMNIYSAPIYTDPSLKTFDASGMYRSIANLLHPGSLKEFVGLHAKGYRQGNSKKENGFHTQMGGVMVIRPEGSVTYHFCSKYLGNFDNPDDWQTE